LQVNNKVNDTSPMIVEIHNATHGLLTADSRAPCITKVVNCIFEFTVIIELCNYLHTTRMHVIYILSQNISAVKKGEAKKVQVTERLKGVISM